MFQNKDFLVFTDFVRIATPMIFQQLAALRILKVCNFTPSLSHFGVNPDQFIQTSMRLITLLDYCRPCLHNESNFSRVTRSHLTSLLCHWLHLQMVRVNPVFSFCELRCTLYFERSRNQRQGSRFFSGKWNS